MRRDRGNGFTVTEMTLEFRTVLFLGRRGERDALKGTEVEEPRVSLHSPVVAQGLVCIVQKELAALL